MARAGSKKLGEGARDVRLERQLLWNEQSSLTHSRREYDCSTLYQGRTARRSDTITRLAALTICGSALSIAATRCSDRTTDVADAAVDAMNSYDGPSNLGTQSETAPTDAGCDSDGR